MATLKALYGLPRTIPFVDVEVDRDTQTFLCPFTVRFLASRDRWAADFVRSMDSFMNVIAQMLTSPRASDRELARRLLSQFKEPRELRLGYTRSGCDGHGAAAVLGDRLAHSLTTDLEPFVRVGMLGRIEDIQVFINGIGSDVVSDIAGRIGLAVLVAYTRQMMIQHPQLAHGPEGTVPHSYRAWDVGRSMWVDHTATLPLAGGRPLILVPGLWVDRNPIVSKERFLELTSLTVLQDLLAGSGRARRSKADIKKAHRPFSAAEINLRVASAELENFGRNLMVHFDAAATLTLQRRFGLTA